MHLTETVKALQDMRQHRKDREVPKLKLQLKSDQNHIQEHAAIQSINGKIH